MNISGTLHSLRLFYNPWMFMPHIAVPTFNQIPLPIPARTLANGQPSTIKVVILDKDNCFAEPHKTEVFADYRGHFDALKSQYSNVLIVSNTAGSPDDPDGSQARELELQTGVKVLPHATKKPGCHSEIWEYVKTQGLADDPSEVAVVGDRLMTDVLMGNLMGATTVWIHQGPVPDSSGFASFERALYRNFKPKDVLEK